MTLFKKKGLNDDLPEKSKLVRECFTRFGTTNDDALMCIALWLLCYHSWKFWTHSPTIMPFQFKAKRSSQPITMGLRTGRLCFRDWEPFWTFSSRFCMLEPCWILQTRSLFHPSCLSKRDQTAADPLNQSCIINWRQVRANCINALLHYHVGSKDVT